MIKCDMQAVATPQATSCTGDFRAKLRDCSQSVSTEIDQQFITYVSFSLGYLCQFKLGIHDEL